MIFMPLEPLANEAIQVHSILYALARNNAIIKLTIGLFTFVACISNGFVACISNGFVAVTNLVPPIS